jgi:hypothetical protein
MTTEIFELNNYKIIYDNKILVSCHKWIYNYIINDYEYHKINIPYLVYENKWLYNYLKLITGMYWIQPEWVPYILVYNLNDYGKLSKTNNVTYMEKR